MHRHRAKVSKVKQGNRHLPLPAACLPALGVSSPWAEMPCQTLPVQWDIRTMHFVWMLRPTQSPERHLVRVLVAGCGGSHLQSTPEAEAGATRAGGQSGLHSDFKDSLGHRVRLHLKLFVVHMDCFIFATPWVELSIQNVRGQLESEGFPHSSATWRPPCR